jgi:hypothetical protein
MTNEELDAIEARAFAATAGPWVYQIDERGGPRACVRERGFADGTPGNRFIFDVMPATAEFIAHARADVPRLVAEVRRLRDALGRLVRKVALLPDDLKAETDIRDIAYILKSAWAPQPEPPTDACPECGEPIAEFDGRRFCECGWGEEARDAAK